VSHEILQHWKKNYALWYSCVVVHPVVVIVIIRVHLQAMCCQPLYTNIVSRVVPLMTVLHLGVCTAADDVKPLMTVLELGLWAAADDVKPLMTILQLGLWAAADDVKPLMTVLQLGLCTAADDVAHCLLFATWTLVSCCKAPLFATGLVSWLVWK